MNDGTTRRQFLRMLAGAGALAAGCASPPPPPDSRIAGELHAAVPELGGTGPIDAHVHLWTADVRNYPRAADFAQATVKPRRYTARDFLATARRMGVERAVLVQPGLYGNDHSYMIDVLREYPHHFVGVGSVDKTHEPEVRLAELGRLGLRGARVVTHTGADSWVDNDHFHRLFEQASRSGLVLDVLCIPEHFAVVDALCADHPEATVVLDHLGRLRGGRYEREDDLDTLCRMSRHPRVHLKLSGFHMLAENVSHYDELIPVFQRVCGEYGAERVMWGSDAPHQFRRGNTYAGSLDWIRTHSGASAGELDWLLRRTAEKVFFS